mgnify:CR=1 FL=1
MFTSSTPKFEGFKYLESDVSAVWYLSVTSFKVVSVVPSKNDLFI